MVASDAGVLLCSSGQLGALDLFRPTYLRLWRSPGLNSAPLTPRSSLFAVAWRCVIRVRGTRTMRSLTPLNQEIVANLPLARYPYQNPTISTSDSGGARNRWQQIWLERLPGSLVGDGINHQS